MQLTLARTGPTTATATRDLAAAPSRVFAAHADAELVRQWLTGPDGWIMPRCEIDARPGGTLRYDWQAIDGSMAFQLTGEFLALDAPHHIRHIERMFLPDRTPDNFVDSRFHPQGSGTRMVMTMSVADPTTLDAMLATDMADGMEASYARLDTLLSAA